MKKKIVSICVCIVMLVTVFVAAMLMVGSAEPRTIYVDDNAPNDPGPNDPTISDPLEDGSLEHPFDMIQEAADISSSGDSVYVFAGTYNEEVIIPTAITLEGEDKETTTIQGSGKGVGISVNGLSEVTIESLKINGFSIGIYLFSCSNITINGNIVSDSIRYGIYLNYYNNGIIITGNTVSTNDEGIRLYSSSYNTISENTISDNMGGLGLYGSSNYNIISGNTVTDNPDGGINIPYDCDNNVISQNVVSDSYIGIYMYVSTGGNILIGNTFTDNWFGIYLYKSSNLSIIENTVSDNDGTGISMHSSSTNTISWNYISDNNGGIYLHLSDDNQIYHNNFVDNNKQLGNSESTNTWNDGEGKGNYWSDYKGLDDGSGGRIPGDGVGDTEIPHLGVDWYPLMGPWDLEDELMYKTEGLIEDVEEMNLPLGNENSLISKLENVIKSIEKGNYGAAESQLNAFTNQVESLEEEGKLTEEHANALIAGAQEVIDYL